MKTISTILKATACCSFLTAFVAMGNEITMRIPSITDEDGKPIEKKINLDQLNDIGRSSEKPLKLKGAKNYQAFKILQEDYVRKHYEGYHIAGTSVSLNKEGRILLCLLLKNDEEELNHVFFDADDVVRKYKKLDDKDLAKMVERVLNDSKKD